MGDGMTGGKFEKSYLGKNLSGELYDEKMDYFKRVDKIRKENEKWFDDYISGYLSSFM